MNERAEPGIEREPRRFVEGRPLRSSIVTEDNHQRALNRGFEFVLNVPGEVNLRVGASFVVVRLPNNERAEEIFREERRGNIRFGLPVTENAEGVQYRDDRHGVALYQRVDSKSRGTMGK